MDLLVNENSLSFFQSFCIKVIKTGRIPKHIAFIMDGNRRNAKNIGITTNEGHSLGYYKLTSVIKWCIELGIREITVFGFSIYNFKRNEDEVSYIMEMAHAKFEYIMKESKQLMELGVRVHVVGRLSLLPEHLRKTFALVMLQTRNNTKLRINMAYSYTGCDEISRTASHLMDGVQNNEISCDDIDEDLISQSLDLGEAELIIRTSGEVRLSDFMTWQCSQSVLYFSEALWPNFTIWKFLTAIIHFQRHSAAAKPQTELSPRKLNFLEELKKKRWIALEKYIDSI